MTLRVAIFGATSTIATEVARIYATRRAHLILAGRDRTGLEALAADLKACGASEVALVLGELADIDALANIGARAWTVANGLDVALIAYGSLPDQTAVQDDPPSLARSISLNFASAAALCAALAPRFEAARAGTLAVITSCAGDRGRQSNYVYGAAKGGLQRYLEGLRHRLQATGVKVLDVRPGSVATRMTAHLPSGKLLSAPPQTVAADIVRAVPSGGVLYTPWYWKPIMLAIRLLPAPIFNRLRL